MDASRLTQNLYNAYVEAGFDVEIPPNTEHFFCIRSDSQSADIAPYVFMRVSHKGVLVFAATDIAAVSEKHRCSAEDLAYALSVAAPEMGKDRVSMEVKEGQIVAHTMINPGLFSSVRSIYNRTYDAMIAARAAISLLEDAVARCIQRRELFGQTDLHRKG